MEKAFDALVKELMSKIPGALIPQALRDLLPLLTEFAQSEVILNDDARAKIQIAMLRVLRKLGMEGVDVG